VRWFAYVSFVDFTCSITNQLDPTIPSPGEALDTWPKANLLILFNHWASDIETLGFFESIQWGVSDGFSPGGNKSVKKSVLGTSKSGRRVERGMISEVTKHAT
jgi:hypothetical protein